MSDGKLCVRCRKELYRFESYWEETESGRICADCVVAERDALQTELSHWKAKYLNDMGNLLSLCGHHEALVLSKDEEVAGLIDGSDCIFCRLEKAEIRQSRQGSGG